MRRKHRLVRIAAAALLGSLAAPAAVPVAIAAEPAPSSGAAAAAAVPTTPTRPKICLVLSGGGARGAAHIGVLQVLEELRVPIHCIAGTSMGALVGGAYASGMTLPEMEIFTKSITSELLFTEKPPRQERSTRRKRDDYLPYFTPEIAYSDGKLGFKKGLVSGIQLETVLREISKVKGFFRFDELPIPFRAVATDLVTGRPVVFKEGELASVMRASMAVPGAVAPAEFGGMLLVDGMLTENLPVATARAMGADIIIAVNVGTPLLRREELRDILGVTSQMLSILTEQNVERSLALLRTQDILITPELGDFSTGDFDSLVKIVPAGERAARQMASRLSALALPPAEFAALRKAQQTEVTPDLRAIDEIRFADMKTVNPRTARALMNTRTGVPVDREVLDLDMRRLFGSGNFEHVSYRFLEEPGRRVLVVNAVEKSLGLDYVRFGLGLSSDFKGDAFFNLIGTYQKNWINSLGAEWRNEVQFGRTSALRSEFYQPLSAEGTFFVAPNFSIERRRADLWRGSDRIATYDSTWSTAGLDLGSLLGRYGEARLGLLTGSVTSQLDTGPTFLAPEPSVRQGAATFRVMFDRLDSAHFPRSGWRGGAKVYNSTSQLGADLDYTKWDLDGAVAYSFGEHTINLGVKFGGNIGSDPLPRHDLFRWGGFLQQSGYATGQLVGERLSFGRLMYYQRILKGTLFEGAYGGVSLEAGKMANPLVPGSPTGTLGSMSLFAAIDTPLGPAYLGYGLSKDRDSSWYFFLGRPF